MPAPRRKDSEPSDALPALLRVESGGVVPRDQIDQLSAWVRLYGMLEAGANAENTLKAKGRDLDLFMRFFHEKVRSDHPDDWTRSVTSAFLRSLETVQSWKATSVNRVLATLRHCAAYIHRLRPFLAGNPCRDIRELVTDEPEWKGLSDVEVMRLRSAGEQLARLKDRRNQHPVRDQAVFLLLLHTGLRISELLALDRSQYRGKHFHDVRRKGKVRSRKVFVPPEAREALDRYLAEARGDCPGPLLCSRSGARLERQHVDRLLKQLAAHANSKLPGQKVRLSAHVLRHTFLRKVTERHGVQFAMEAAGHTSSRYIWRYIKPSEEKKEKALEDLF